MHISCAITTVFDGERRVRPRVVLHCGGCGDRIWSLLEVGRSLEDVFHTLTQEYECAEQQCTDDLLAFIEELGG